MFSKRQRHQVKPVGEVRRSRPAIELLEFRQLLSASIGDLSNIRVLPASHQAASSANVSTSIDGYTPEQIRKAYGFDQVTLGNGVAGDGSGQTIAIVTAYNDPNIVSDLHTFDAAMGVNDDFSLSVVSQSGGKASSIVTDAGWAAETALDVEWAHAIAPHAKILLVEANSASLGNLLTAVDYARHADGVSVVSMSWGANEFWSQTAYDDYFTTPSGHQGVTFVAASGDEGSWWGPSWPSSSSNVLAVGGTTLSIDPSTGAASGETGWGGSGGGVSSFEGQPAYQDNVQRTGARTAPDVSYDANPYTGYAFYNSVDDGSGTAGWGVVGGTSAGTPQWAALIAIANQGRAAAGKATLDGATGTLPTLYALYNDPTAYAAAFNDVSLGRSSFFAFAHTGYDAVTGLGTPKAAGVVRALVGNAATPSDTSSVAATTATRRRSRVHLARRSTPVGTNTATTSNTDVLGAPPAAAVLTAHRSFDFLQADARSSGLSDSAQPSGGSQSFGSAGTGARGLFASAHRISTIHLAGYEPAALSKPQVTPIALVGSGRAVVGGTADGSNIAPWALMGVTSSDSAIAPEVDSGLSSASLPDAPLATTVTERPLVITLSGPRAVAIAVAAIAVEILVLSYRRVRRQLPNATTGPQQSGMSPLKRD